MEHGGPHEHEAAQEGHDSGMPGEAENDVSIQSTRSVDPAPASPETTPLTPRKRDTQFYRDIGKKGGETLKAKRGSEHFQSIAQKGGKENARRHKLSHFSDMGRRGGEKTKERQGAEFYKEIGKKGAAKRREKRLEREARERQEHDAQ